MANRIKGITLEIGGNTTQLDKALSGVNKTISETQSQLRDVDKLLKLDPKNTELLAQKQRLLTEQIGNTKDKLAELKTYAAAANEALAKGEISQAQFEAIQREIVSTEKDLQKLEGQLKETKWGEWGETAKKAAKISAEACAAVATAVAAVGAATVKAGKELFNLANDVSKAGDEIDKMSQKIGISAEAYQEWDYVFERSGTDVNNLQSGMKKLSDVITDAASGSSSAAKSLEAVGLSIEDLNGKSQDEQLSLVITALQNMEAGAERTSAATDLLGKSATELGAVLNMSAEETAALKQEAEEYGMVMSNDAVKASASFQDSLTKLQGTANGLKNSLVADLLPGMTQVMDGLSDLIKGNDGAIESIEAGISSVIDNLANMLPAVESVLTVLVSLISKLAPKIIAELPKLLGQILPPILKMIGEIATALAEVAPDIITTIVETLVDCLPEIIDCAVQIMVALIEGMVKMMPQLIPTMLKAVNTISDAIIRNLPIILQAATKIIGELIKGLIQNFPQIAKAGADAIKELGKAFNPANAITWGADMISGLIQGLTSNTALGSIGEGAKKVASKISNFLHFSEPEEGPLHGYMKWMPDFINGMVKGIEQNEYKLADAAEGMANNLTVSGEGNVSGMLNQYLPYLAQGNVIMLDTGELVGATAKSYNAEFGKIARLEAVR